MEQPIIRRAVEGDLPAVVRLFALPEEGNLKPEDPERMDAYRAALSKIVADSCNMLMVAEVEGAVVGAFQLTIIQYVAYTGGRVAMIEAVIVDPAVRGRGVGEAMMRWAIEESRRQGCFRVQLTSNKVRKRAHRFYERLGFVATHEGMKLKL